jgi:hypothetical protein
MIGRVSEVCTNDIMSCGTWRYHVGCRHKSSTSHGSLWDAYVRAKGIVITRRWCHDDEEERHHDHVRCL